MGTIYKQMLMGNKKGDLGHVWIAAHFPHRIRKQLVEQTNISSSVDKILVDQLPIVTYRILGFLLLGVTRLYSKKVEYLLVDCNHSLYEMKVYCEGRKKVNINVGGMCLPESSSQRSKTNILGMNVPESSSGKKYNTFMEAMHAEFSSISLPENFELDAFDLQVVEDESSSEQHVKSHLEIVLPDEWENDETGHHSETSPENLRDRFSMDECLVPMELDEEVTLPKIPFIEEDPEWKNTNSSYDNMIFEDRENINNKHHDEECTTMVLETTLIDDNITVKPTPEKRQLSVSVDVTPRSKGKHKSDNMGVRTPAVRERVRASRKRTCVYDDTLVIRNVVYKEWVTDASDLLRKRRKALTSTQSFDCFMEPIIPSKFCFLFSQVEYFVGNHWSTPPVNAGFPSDIRSAISKIELLQVQQVEAGLEVDDGVGVGVGVGSSGMHKDSEENEAIAPSTPVTQSASKANQEGPTSSCETGEKHLFPTNDVEIDSFKLKEVIQLQGPSSSTLQNQGHENWSALTRSVGGYLHTNFTQRQRQDEVVKLSHILKQKTKRESAMFFSEILLLKTGGYIDVKQEKPYDEIYVMQTFKLKEAFGADTRE